MKNLLANKKVIWGGLGLVLILVLVLGFIIWQKSQTANTPAPATNSGPTIKKVDMASQPQWVQDLVVTATKGVSANGLPNVTVEVEGIAPEAKTLEYVLQYQTANKGSQGALSTIPIQLNGATTWTKTIDLGTCSTKSCVRHDGVTEVELQLDFIDSGGNRSTWTNSIAL